MLRTYVPVGWGGGGDIEYQCNIHIVIELANKAAFSTTFEIGMLPMKPGDQGPRLFINTINPYS